MRPNSGTSSRHEQHDGTPAHRRPKPPNINTPAAIGPRPSPRPAAWRARVVGPPGAASTRASQAHHSHPALAPRGEWSAWGHAGRAGRQVQLLSLISGSGSSPLPSPCTTFQPPWRTWSGSSLASASGRRGYYIACQPCSCWRCWLQFHAQLAHARRRYVQRVCAPACAVPFFSLVYWQRDQRLLTGSAPAPVRGTRRTRRHLLLGSRTRSPCRH